jgi:hypothetical protein
MDIAQATANSKYRIWFMAEVYAPSTEFFNRTVPLGGSRCPSIAILCQADPHRVGTIDYLELRTCA